MEALTRAIVLSSPSGLVDLSKSAEGPTVAEAEVLIETADIVKTMTVLSVLETRWTQAFAMAILRDKDEVATVSHLGRRPGYLVLNPSCFPRQSGVFLPDAAIDLRAEGPLKAVQFTKEGVCGVVNLPSFGFAWVSRQADPNKSSHGTTALAAHGRQIRNEFIEVELDHTTGGIRSLAAVGESSAAWDSSLCSLDCSTQRVKRSRLKCPASNLSLTTEDQHLFKQRHAGAWLIPREVPDSRRSCNDSGCGRAGQYWRLILTLLISRNHGVSAQLMPTHGASILHAAGHGQIPVQCFGGVFGGHQRSQILSTQRRLNTSTFRLERSGLQSSSKGSRIIANKEAGCLTHYSWQDLKETGDSLLAWP